MENSHKIEENWFKRPIGYSFDNRTTYRFFAFLFSNQKYHTTKFEEVISTNVTTRQCGCFWSEYLDNFTCQTSTPHSTTWQIFAIVVALSLAWVLFCGQLLHTKGVEFSNKGIHKVLTVFIFKDGAYFCYCAYVLRISRYSDFLSVMLTNTGIFLRSLKLSGESRS